MQDLRSLPICVQKLTADLSHESAMNRVLADETLSAIFLTRALWGVGTTLTVAFTYGSNPIKWYDISMIEPHLAPADMDIERRVRTMSHDAAVRTVITELLMPLVPGIRFEFIDDYNSATIRVLFDKNGGSASQVGTSSSDVPAPKQTTNFGWMDVGTILHEFGHVLGMLHEHQNPRGGIQWNTEAVYEWAAQTQGWDKEETDVNILQRYSIDTISGSQFDPKSVMLYFYPAYLTLNGKGTSENLRYSATDKLWLSGMYPQFGPRKTLGTALAPGPTTTATAPPAASARMSPLLVILLAIILVAALILLIIR